MISGEIAVNKFAQVCLTLKVKFVKLVKLVKLFRWPNNKKTRTKEVRNL